VAAPTVEEDNMAYLNSEVAHRRREQALTCEKENEINTSGQHDRVASLFSLANQNAGRSKNDTTTKKGGNMIDFYSIFKNWTLKIKTKMHYKK